MKTEGEGLSKRDIYEERHIGSRGRGETNELRKALKKKWRSVKACEELKIGEEIDFVTCERKLDLVKNEKQEGSLKIVLEGGNR